jgi:hypothetical protein
MEQGWARDSELVWEINGKRALNTTASQQDIVKADC